MILQYGLKVYKLSTDGRSSRTYASAISHSKLYYELSFGERTTTSGNLVQSTGLVIYNGAKDINKEDVIEINSVKYKISSIQTYYDPTVANRVYHTEILLGNVVNTITVI